MKALIVKIGYRYRYWHRRFWRALGICERCGCWRNRTTKGRPICPQCGR